jgi:hypothetical protein
MKIRKIRSILTISKKGGTKSTSKPFYKTKIKLSNTTKKKINTTSDVLFFGDFFSWIFA